jgi:hypothetical protein
VLKSSLRGLLGQDYFISYRHRESADYALALAKNLVDSGFSCFLDRWNVSDRGELRPQLARGLRHSKVLIMIGTDEAFESEWVAWEVKTFSEYRRKQLIAISIDNSLGRIDLDGTPFEVFKDRVYLTENLSSVIDARPSHNILSHIRRTYLFSRRDRIRKRLFFIIIPSLIIATFLLGAVVGWALKAYET